MEQGIGQRGSTEGRWFMGTLGNVVQGSKLTFFANWRLIEKLWLPDLNF